MVSAGRIAAVGFALSWTAASGAWSGETQPPRLPPAPVGAAIDPTPAEEPSIAALEQAKDAFKQGAWEDALDAAVAVLESRPDDLDALYIEGASERQLNRLDEAERHLETLVEASPRFPFAHFQLGFVLFLEADELARRGEAAAANAKYLEAAREFGAELERAPDNAPSLSSRAIALARAGQFEESVRAHEAWIEAAPKKNAPVTSLAATYAVEERPSEAMSALDRLPDKSGKAVSAAAGTVAGVFVARKEWGAAIPFLEMAADRDSASKEARALLTEGYARAGMPDDVASSLKALLGMDPTPEDAERVGEAITSSLGDGTSARSVPGVEPPAVLRIPSPRYPKGQASNVDTVVRVLTLVRQDGAVIDTVLVPNRIWRDIRESGFEAAAIDAIKQGRFAAGTRDGQLAALWLVVSVKFAGA